MDAWYTDLPESEGLDRLAGRVDASERVQSVFLTGSRARGTATANSDTDLIVVLDRGDVYDWTVASDGLDVRALTLDGLRDIPEDPGRWWDRYSFCHTKVLLDRSDGAVPRLMEAWSVLSPEEVASAVDFYIDAYLTYAHLSMESHREGRRGAARLDASESLPWAISLLFALHGRVRPSNKYLEWELEHYPFEGATGDLESQTLLGLFADILDTGSPEAQRRVFALIEPAARRLGFGGVIDGFGPAIDLLRS